MNDTGLRLRNGMRVMISGAGSGLGRLMVEAFVKAGARVHICDVAQAHLDECCTATGATGSLANVGEAADVDRWFQEAEATLGGLDVLINNAGIAGPTGFAEEIGVQDWDRTIAIDLNGMFYCARRAIPMLKQAGREFGDAAIVNVSSTAGRFGYSQRTPYAAAKWGVVGLTESLALELGPHNVRVNALQPGTTASERTERTIQAKAQATGRSADAIRQDMLSVMALRRFVPPEDIASTALFLASTLSRSITGQSISVCGGTVRMW